MTVIELWNACADWWTDTTAIVRTSGGDDLETFTAQKDCIRRYDNAKVSSFSSDPVENTIIEIEV